MMHDRTGGGKFSVSASKPEVPMFQLVDNNHNMETKISTALSMFSGSMHPTRLVRIMTYTTEPEVGNGRLWPFNLQMYFNLNTIPMVALVFSGSSYSMTVVN